MGTAPDKAGERHLYRVKVPTDPAAWPEVPACLTCSDMEPMYDSTVEPTSEEPVRDYMVTFFKVFSVFEWTTRTIRESQLW